ncbi:MAG: YeeE/YedE thiosulfate transporter family protein [Vulcanimicrobiota bacterium]
MNAPFYKFGMFGDNTALMVAFGLGLGFGFFLERAGFGSAKKLTAQFYFRDLAVLKVMFTAIVTAAVGLFLLSWGGLVDLAQVSLKPTLWAANILGGLILGMGFVIGGYCPGTSVVGSATGRLDAWTYMGGLAFGMFCFGEVVGLAPRLAALIDLSEAPRLTLAQLSGLPYGLLVLAVAVMAGLAFLAAEWAEVKLGGKKLEDQPLLGASGWNVSRALLGLLLAGGVVAAAAGNPYRGPRLTIHQDELASLIQQEADHMTVDELADHMIAGTVDFRLIDVRPAEAYARGTIAGAESIPLAELVKTDFDPREKLVLFTDGQTHAAEAWIFLQARGMKSVYVLLGGLDAWHDEVLYPEVSDPDDPADARRIARARAFGGTPMTRSHPGGPAPLEIKTDLPEVAPPTPSAPVAPPVKKKRREGC